MKWECPACTFLNLITSVRCEMCDTPRTGVTLTQDVFENPQNYIDREEPKLSSNNNNTTQNHSQQSPHTPKNDVTQELTPIKFQKYIRSSHDINLDKSDQGMCLTMHQPWASLLVHGIKRTEGRTWNTSFRGRLWIHAAAKEVDPEEIDIIENTYTELYSQEGINNIDFPSLYPTSALLGCVEVVDVVSDDDLPDSKYPDELKREGDSPFNFICVNPQRLLLPVEMSGEHKIWRIARKDYSKLQAGLRPAAGPHPVIFPSKE